MRVFCTIRILAILGLITLAVIDAIDAATVTHGQVVAKDHYPQWFETVNHYDADGRLWWVETVNHPERWVIVILGTNSKCKFRTRDIEVGLGDFERYEINMDYPQLELTRSAK